MTGGESADERGERADTAQRQAAASTSDDTQSPRADERGPNVDAATSASGAGTALRRWLLLEANRFGITVVLLLAVVVVVYGLGALDVIGVARSAPVRTLFGAVVTGVFTVVSIVLAINQLVLSRVFGSPNDLADRMAGNVDFRDRVADASGDPDVPTDPQAFLAHVVAGVRERASDLGDAERDDVADLADDVVDWAEGVTDRLEGREFGTFGVLSTVLRDDYSEHVAAGRRLLRDGDLEESTATSLSATVDLLESVGIARQYLKTVFLQQELAGLSRTLLYFGVPSLLTAVLAVLMYGRAGGPPLSGEALLVAVSVAVGVAISPLALLFAYVLRLATIARLTATVGPFTPREEKSP